jgi:hypothetical protein
MTTLTQINQFVNGDKTSKIFQNEDGTYIVEFTDGVELFLNAGNFSTEALAEAKAQEMLAAESYNAEMLVGDVVVTE